MVRQVVWTEKAQNDRIAIFTYWNKRNKSVVFSKKLHELIKESLQLICKHPMIGRLTSKENVRVKVIRDYLIIYEITEKRDSSIVNLGLQTKPQ
jgi:addiction module RelE/StbE family toxin